MVVGGSKYEVLQSEIRWLDELRKTKIDVVGAVDFAIINRGDRHKLNMLVKLPQQYGDNLTVSMDLKGNIFEPSSLDGTGYLEGKKYKVG